MSDGKNNKDKARQITPATIKRLFMLSGGECSMPTCNKHLIAEDGKTVISKVCHIEAASEGGPRFNPDMTDDERRGFDNLTLMCDEHHSIIDAPGSEIQYPTELLREWKRAHESKVMQKKLAENPSLLVDVINEISKLDPDEGQNVLSETKFFEIEEKIKYNNVIRYRTFIDEYKVYSGKIEKIYKEMDKYGQKKNRLLRNIKHLYLKAKNNYVAEGDAIKAIKENSDNILDDVEKMLFSKFKENDNKKNVCDEDIDVGIMILMVDAFIRCKILENPSK